LLNETELASQVKQLEENVKVLKAELDATKRLLRDLAIATMGDSPETASFLERLKTYTVEAME
jgi:hypothetical protein